MGFEPTIKPLLSFPPLCLLSPPVGGREREREKERERESVCVRGVIMTPDSCISSQNLLASPHIIYVMDMGMCGFRALNLTFGRGSGQSVHRHRFLLHERDRPPPLFFF